VCRAAADHDRSGEILTAGVALQVARRAVLNDALDETLDQAASPTLAITIQK
jgi:hypothetical protein